MPMFFDFTMDIYMQNYSHKTEILPFYYNHTVHLKEGVDENCYIMVRSWPNSYAFAHKLH